jgi:alpha-beta hydrolase superfamily lysophospholipase
MLEKKYLFLSNNKMHTINTVIWEPETKKINGIVQISHGMCEHIYRYKHFAKFLAGNGYIVCGNDHAGHGESYSGVRGFMGYENGFINMAEDLNHITQHMKLKYPSLPHILLGHSMGSFLARAYTIKYGKSLTGAIFMGTKGQEPNLNTALSLANLMIGLGRGKQAADVLQKLSFKYYNSTYDNIRTEFDWLSRDTEAVSEYISDSKCNFVFTFYGYRDLFELLKYVSDEKWYLSYPKGLPALLVSGLCDPVGGYGKGVREVYNGLKNHGATNIGLKLYEGCRHELINELNKAEVYNDLLKWIKNNS